jgi:serine/threonine protein kinase
MYEMATGRRPFVGDSAMSTIASLLKDTPPSLMELRTDLPKRLARIVDRCLIKDARLRQQSARDLANDLSEVREQLRSPDPGAAKPIARFRAIPWIMAGVAIVIGAVGGTMAHSFAMSTSPTVSASSPPRFAVPVKRFTRLTTEYGPEIGPQISPDGTWITYAAGLPGSLDVYRQRVGGTQLTNLTQGSKTNNWQPCNLARWGANSVSIRSTGRRYFPHGSNRRVGATRDRHGVSSRMVARRKATGGCKCRRVEPDFPCIDERSLDGRDRKRRTTPHPDSRGL